MSTLASAPLTFEYFGLWSAIGILVNPIVIQISTISIVCGFLFCITSMWAAFEIISDILFYCSSRSIIAIDAILRFCKDNILEYISTIDTIHNINPKITLNSLKLSYKISLVSIAFYF